MIRYLLVALVLAITPAAAQECCGYDAVITACYDGDTCTAQIKLGLGVSIEQRLRLARIDTPELRGPEREQGLKVRDIVREMVVGKEVSLLTDNDKTGKYGRLLVEIFVNKMNLNDYLAIMGHAEYVDY